MTSELRTGGGQGYLRIATEEAFATQEQILAILAPAIKQDLGVGSASVRRR
jgi:hypothetical protein